MELEPALSLGPCNVPGSYHFLSFHKASSHFHDVAPLGPPGVVDLEAAVPFCPACLYGFVVVNCSSPSDCYHSLSSNCSCSPCGCSSLCGLSFPYKPLFSQVPSASRSPELNRLASLKPAFFLGSCNDFLGTFHSCFMCFSSCSTSLTKDHHTPSCCGSTE